MTLNQPKYSTTARLVLGAAFLLCGISTAPAAELTVTVIGLESNSGDVHIALYDTAEKFPKSGQMLFQVRPKPENKTATGVFKDLAPGRYAIAVYHDANDDNQFNQGLLGIPLEGFGFSNKATVFLGPPSFEDAAVTLPINGIGVEINLAD